MRIDIWLEEPHRSTRIQAYDEIRSVFREHNYIPPRIIRRESTETFLPLRTFGDYDVDFVIEFMQRLVKISNWKYVEKVSVR